MTNERFTLASFNDQLALDRTSLAWFALRRLKRGEPPKAQQWPLSLVLALTLSALFLVGLWALF